MTQSTGYYNNGVTRSISSHYQHEEEVGSLDTSAASTTPDSQGLTIINRAIISTYNKEGIASLAQELNQRDVLIYSSDGTAQTLLKNNIATTDVGNYTDFPAILDGRVKTLHPKVHGGILAQRDNPEHTQVLQLHQIKTIDLVVVNLYPFHENPSIEMIDIGGSALLRAAAKNHHHVVAISSPDDYQEFLTEYNFFEGQTSLEFRRHMASLAFARCSAYDAAVATWLGKESHKPQPMPPIVGVVGTKQRDLRYGENPHQKAAVYATQTGGIVNADLVLGKPLSYNNMVDADTALSMCQDFQRPSVAIIKHAIPCGVAEANTLIEAWHAALMCDNISAFGGIVAVNRLLDEQIADVMSRMFLEVVVAPKITKEALNLFGERRNQLRILITNTEQSSATTFQTRNIAGGFLWQERDTLPINSNSWLSQNPKVAETLSLQTRDDVNFALKVARRTHSNAIVIVSKGATIGIGCGQTSRVEAAHHAVTKAVRWYQANHSSHSGLPDGTADVRADNISPPPLHNIDAVAASDGFFPFRDGLDVLADAGITTIVHPGGSRSDAVVQEAALERNVTLLHTGMRLFSHG